MGNIFSLNITDQIPLTCKCIADASKKDVLLSKAIDLTISGWPTNVGSELKQYFKRRHEFFVEQGCLLVGSRIVIPKALENKILAWFHRDHIGIVRTKMLKSYCWWPEMDLAIEKFISFCEICQETKNFTNSTKLLPWPAAPHNFFRVSIDFFHKHNVTFLILVDSRSKWIDVKLMLQDTNARSKICALKEIFSVIGLPVQLVSDNGPPFNSTEFLSFCTANGITPIKSPPYHPQSNGLAERGVQTVKKGLEKLLLFNTKGHISPELVQEKLANFLFSYRNNSPSTSTGLTPAECIFKTKPRTAFDLIKPSSHTNKKLIPNLDLAKSNILYRVNDQVYVKNLKSRLSEKGIVVKVMS